MIRDVYNRVPFFLNIGQIYNINNGMHKSNSITEYYNIEVNLVLLKVD